MGLADAAGAAVEAVFNLLNPDLVDAVLTHFTSASPVYDPSTGVLADPTTTHPITLLRSRWTRSELYTRDIQQGQSKYLLPTSRLSFEPTERDYFTIGTQRWIIKSYWTDPFEKLYTFKVERV